MGRTLPTVRNWLAGEIDTGAYMNSVAAWMRFLQTPPSASLQLTVAQAVATSTFAAAALDTELYDTDGGHSLTTNTSRYTVQVAGKYAITAYIKWDTNGTGNRIATIYKNGVELPNVQVLVPAAAANFQGLTASTRAQLAVGDYIEAVGWQSSGGNLNIIGARLEAKWDSL